MSLPTPDDLAWDLRAKELRATELERLRGVAEKWRNGLASMTGAVALATAAGAPFIGKQLAGDDTKVALAISMGLSLLLLTIASAQGMRAAFGYPAAILNTGPALRRWSEEQIKKTLGGLRCALVCTIGGLLFLAISAGIAYFGSDTPDSEITGIVRVDPQTEVCGSVTIDDAVVALTARDGTVHRFRLADIAVMEYPKACP